MTAAATVQVLDGEVVRRWLSLAADALGQARSAIDALNVFPVPDADTGTNLYRTMVCATEALAALPPRASSSEVWRAAASGALLGACGNSGIIVSQLLRGLADTCGPASPCDGPVVALALVHAAALARAAVHRPAEGTLLTVADAAALAAGRGIGLAEVTREAALGARLALTQTQRQLAVLAASGVVDAGAAGLCVVLDALSAAISGTAPGGYAVPEPAAGRGVNAADLAAAALTVAGASPASSPHAYEVTFLLAAAERQVTELRSQLDLLGDSLVVSGGDPQWHVHVHVADAGAVIEAAMVAGRPSRITVTYLLGPRPGPDPAAGRHWVVTAARGAGLDRLLRAAGAVVVPGQDAGASLTDLPEVIGLAGSKIIIRHNGSSGAAVIRRGAVGSGTEPPAGWPVIDIDCAVQALAALAVHDPLRELQDDVAAMRRAVQAMRWGSVGLADGPGDLALVGRIGDQPVAAGADQRAVAVAVLDRLLAPGAELVTLLSGQAADSHLHEQVAADLRGTRPALEVVCYDGGMSGAILLIGAE
jgi:DAK2 domain fusion protein YloV